MSNGNMISGVGATLSVRRGEPAGVGGGDVGRNRVLRVCAGQQADFRQTSSGDRGMDVVRSAWRAAGGVHDRRLFEPRRAPYTLRFSLWCQCLVCREADFGWARVASAVYQDRLGTNRASGNAGAGTTTNGARFYPYGDEITSTANDREKFGTYTRDSYTGLDYADQRYYASTYGRFNTPDPYAEQRRPK